MRVEAVSKNLIFEGSKPFQVAELIKTAVWRIPYGRAGILDFFLRVLALESVPDNVLIHSLRLVGNSCADVGMW